jgi:hypothetical protein
MQTILSYGMGVESTAILVRWLEDASVRPCRLDELIVITSHTGEEYADTYRDVETYVLPLLRKHRVRYVQVARAGSSQTNGIGTPWADLSRPTNLPRCEGQGR